MFSVLLPPMLTAFTPAMPLKKGHLAMLMASGLMDTLSLTDDGGHPMLVKGRVVKVVDKTTHRGDHDPTPWSSVSATAA